MLAIALGLISRFQLSPNVDGYIANLGLQVRFGEPLAVCRIDTAPGLIR
jgi:hypothetical protein